MKINIKTAVYAKLKKLVKSSKEFKTIDSYVDYILREVIKKTDRQRKTKDVYNKKEEKKIKQRLRNLGYID